jgi:hypothetical protein
LLGMGARIGSLEAPLYLYRWHASSRSNAERDRMDQARLAVQRRHWELAPPTFALEQIRASRVAGHARLHASAFAQLAIGMSRRGLSSSAVRIAVATVFYNPRGVLELVVSEARRRWPKRVGGAA